MLSITFFACHSSGVMLCARPVLYCVTSCFACSRPEEEVNKVLLAHCQPSVLLKGCVQVMELSLARMQQRSQAHTDPLDHRLPMSMSTPFSSSCDQVHITRPSVSHLPWV